MSFPKDFIWGVASAAYQTEGAAFEDGKGASIWDTFSHQSGATFEGDNGDIACDGYHRYEEDIAIMAKLGVRAYRFSVSWPRIFPTGDGEINQKGLAYYDKVVDCCLSYGIEPYVTLYHWDLPQALEDKGGWQNRSTCEAFARYCRVVSEHFGGRVKNYFTLNENQCVVSLGYSLGLHAPGKKLSTEEAFGVWHNLLLAHGLAFREIRKANPEAKISLATTGRLCYPESDSAEDLDAARKQTFEVTDDDWLFTHQMVLDPVIFGHYPEAGGKVLSKLISDVPRNELEIIHTGLDTLAINVYNGSAVYADVNGAAKYAAKKPGCRRTALKWPVTPEVMEFGPRFLWERYQKPVLITENGVSCNDFVYLDGKVHDKDRIDFLSRYLRCLNSCVESGVPVEGYFHWAFTDNFEWHSGYGERLGLVYVDYQSQERILKDSAVWYSELVAENGSKL